MPQVESQTTVGELSEAQCAHRLAGMFADADVPQQWPADSETIVTVLRHGGAYDVSLELLESWARSQSVGRVSIRSGTFAWGPGNMLAAAALANASRLWLLDAKHIHKMSALELAELQARAVGQSVFTDLDAVDIRSLIGVISSTDDGALRSTLCLGLLAKLRKDGVLQ